MDEKNEVANEVANGIANEVAIRERLAYLSKTMLAGYTGIALLAGGFASMLFAGQLFIYWPVTAIVVFLLVFLVGLCVVINVRIARLIKRLEV